MGPSGPALSVSWKWTSWARAPSSGKSASAWSWVETAPIFEALVARFGLYAQGRAIHLYLPEHAPRV